MSAAIGSALAGARTITATSSQGLALMAEVVYIAASMRAPIVMAVGNRALSGPINIHCDHSDSMLIRDSGVVQLFAENAQEAYDLMVIAPRLAEHPDVLLPVLVCQDGFTITHSAEPVDAARGRRRSRRSSATTGFPHPLLDVAQPDDAGPVRDARLLLRAAPPAGRGDRRARSMSSTSSRTSSSELSGRHYGALEAYRLDGRRARDRLPRLDRRNGQGRRRRAAGEGEPVGLSRSRSFRPFPAGELRAALRRSATVIVLDRADSPGGAPPLFAEVAAALYGSGRRAAQPRLRARRPRPASRGRPRDLRRRARPPTSA